MKSRECVHKEKIHIRENKYLMSYAGKSPHRNKNFRFTNSSPVCHDI